MENNLWMESTAMAKPRGRPKGEVETEMLAVRIPVDLGQQLNRHLDRLETRTGIKANRASIARHALKVFLDAQDREHEQTRQEPQPPATPPIQTTIQSRTKVLLPIRPGSPRGIIVKLLQQHPEGLSPAQVKELLQLDKPARDTLRSMERDGILKRIETGLYAVDDLWSSTFPNF